MQIKEYMELSERTFPKLDKIFQDEVHMLFGMITEVGELIDGYKKELAYNKHLDTVNVKEEIGDLMWYIANFCRMNGFDLEEILDTNIAKLRARYPEKFTEEKAINRDLDKETQILEK